MLPSVALNAGLKPGSAQFADPAGCQLTKYVCVFSGVKVSNYFNPSIASIGSTKRHAQPFFHIYNSASPSTKLTGISPMNTQTTGRLNAVEDDFDDLEAWSDTVDERLTQIDRRQEQIIVRLNQLERQFKQISDLFSLPGAG